jgi:hypothetical protein
MGRLVAPQAGRGGHSSVRTRPEKPGQTFRAPCDRSHAKTGIALSHDEPPGDEE